MSVMRPLNAIYSEDTVNSFIWNFLLSSVCHTNGCFSRVNQNNIFAGVTVPEHHPVFDSIVQSLFCTVGKKLNLAARILSICFRTWKS